MTLAMNDLEDFVRRQALKSYLRGDEEEALDLLAVAREMAPGAAANRS